MAFYMSKMQRVLEEVDKEFESIKNETLADDAKKQLVLIRELLGPAVANDVNADYCQFVPDFDQEYQMDFDPILIGTNILSKIGTVGREAVIDDVYTMIEFYIQGGYNLEYMIEKTPKPEFASTLRRLIKTYNLVSKATNSESMTLYRICESFPELTCSYLTKSPNSLIPFDTMNIFTCNYPKVMMTSAFAYLIPNKTEIFCLLLKEAHMVYRYALYFCTRPGILSKIDDDAEIISQCLQFTHSAINRSVVPYSKQIQFLKQHDLITVEDNKITVTGDVYKAAEMWKEKILQDSDN